MSGQVGALRGRCQHIIVDRTGFTLKNADDRLMVQTVHPKIYKASCPYDFRSLDIVNVPSVYKGFVFELNPNA